MFIFIVALVFVVLLAFWVQMDPIITCFVILVLLFAALLAPAKASAMNFIVQDDPGLMDLDRRSTTLDRMVELGASDVRVFVQHQRKGPADNFLRAGAMPPLEAYAPVFQAIRDRGLRVYANLSWYGQSDPGAIARWADTAARVLGPLVDSWAILNEPDLSLSAGCTPSREQQLVSTGAVETRRVKRYRFVPVSPRSHAQGVRYRRVMRIVNHKRVIRYLGTTRRRGRYVRRAYFTTIAGSQSEPTSTGFACEKATSAEVYTRILSAVAPVIRAADPGSLIVGGELSPVAGVSTFARNVDWSTVDAASIHPYYGSEMSIDKLDRRSLNLPARVLASEFGVQVSLDGQSELISRAWQFARASGLEAMAQYMVWGESPHGWNTSVLPAFGATTSEAFEALRSEGRNHG